MASALALLRGRFTINYINYILLCVWKMNILCDLRYIKSTLTFFTANSDLARGYFQHSVKKDYLLLISHYSQVHNCNLIALHTHTHTETKHRPNCNSKIDNANLVKKCAKHIDCLSNIYLWFHSQSQSLRSFFPPRQHSHSSRQASRLLPLWREGKCNA